MLSEPRDQAEAKCAELAQAIEQQADDDQLEALILGIGVLHDQRTLETLVAIQGHPGATVRRAVAKALPMAMVVAERSSAGVAALISLCADENPEVRDWATCSLGRTLAADRADLEDCYDTAEVRAALTARLVDTDPATRAEACAGLALRGVGDVVAPLRRELARPDVGRVPVIAAEALGSAELHDSLLALRSWWTRDPALLDRAIRACAPGDIESTRRSQHG